jgi:hypothetical protein
MTIMTTPKFQHDCERCKFLGHSKKHAADLYYCEGAVLGISLIARTGNDGWEYGSHLMPERTLNPKQYIDILKEHDSPAIEILEIMKSKGLYSGDI